MARAKVVEINNELELHCPDDHKMVLRNGKYGKFYGCSTYPKCKNTCNLNDATQLIRDFRKPKVAREFKPSKYQQNIFNWIDFWAKEWEEHTSNGQSRHLVVKADAGSGKTTTALQALDLLPRGKQILFSCFNKSIATELGRRAPAWVRVGTLHSVGFNSLKKHLPLKPEVDDGKVWNIIKELMPNPEHRPLHSVVRKLVSLVKATLTDPMDLTTMNELVTHYDIELNGNAKIILEVTPQVIKLCLERLYVIDYDDMIWLPIVMDLPLAHYDWLFVDECQDLNACQLELVTRLVNSTGHIVAIGDEKQSIYGFRGADVDAIPNIIERLEADVLSLGISYRNSTAILDHVKKELPFVTTEATPWAGEGIVDSTSYSRLMQYAQDGNLVLCRVNAPLVKACYSFIRQGRKAVIRGRDIGKSLLAFIDKLKPVDLHDLLKNLAAYKYDQAEKLAAMGKEARIQALYDRCDTLEALCEDTKDLLDLRRNIEKIFNDVQKQGIILSSVHRAKGDEADRVYILEPGLMPHPLAKADWQIEQEMNIKYVALTRAKTQLIYVEG